MSRFRYLICWLILVIVGLAIYFQTFSFGFVFDDNTFIVTNHYIKDLHHLGAMWSGNDVVQTKTRFIGLYSFALNYALGHLNPAGYHIFNFIVHLLVTGLVWATAGLIIKVGTKIPSSFSQDLPFFIALIFLVHPCQTQAVSYITQRFESLATLFYLGTVYLYLSARVSSSKPQKVVLFFLAGLSAILGMFTKEVMVTVPLTVGAIEFILLPHPKRKGLRLKPAMFLSAGVVLFFLLLMKLLNYKMNDLFSLHPSESHDGDMITMGSYLLTEMRVFLTFLRLLVLPIHQSLDYNYSISKGILQPPLTLMGIGVITVMMVLVIKLRRRWPVIAFGLAWVLITFSINMVPRSNVIFEHKLYLISFGFFLAAVVFLSTVIRQQRILTGVLIAIIAVLAITCFERNLVWRNSLTLWEDEVSKSHKQRAYANLGQAYIEVARYQDALVILNKAIAMKPDDYISYYNRAVVYHHLGQYQSAYNDFSKVVSAKSDVTPLYVETLVNRSSLFVSTQQFGWAIQDLDRAQKADPGCVEVYKDRAYCLLKMGRRYESFGDFQSALRLDPDDTRLGLQYRSLLMYDAIEKTLGFNMESFRKVFAK